MSTIAVLLRSGPFLGRTLIVLIAHIPIVIITVALLPALLIGFTLCPARYAEVLKEAIGQLQSWSCAVTAPTRSDAIGKTPEDSHDA